VRDPHALSRLVVGIGAVAVGTFVVMGGLRLGDLWFPKSRSSAPGGASVEASLWIPASPKLAARRIADRHCVSVIQESDAVLRRKLPVGTVDFAGADRAVKAIVAAVHEYDVLDPEAACSPEVRAGLIDYVRALLTLSKELGDYPRYADASRPTDNEKARGVTWKGSVEGARDSVIDAREALEKRIAAP
jgi:hypothetical protein